MAFSLNMFLDNVLEKYELKRINRNNKQKAEKETRKLITDLMSTLRDFQIEVSKTAISIETVKQNGFSNSGIADIEKVVGKDVLDKLTVLQVDDISLITLANPEMVIDTELALMKSISELTNTWTSIKARYAECPSSRVHYVYWACDEESLFTRYTYVTENYLKLLSEALSIMFKRLNITKSGSVTTNDNKVKSDSVLPVPTMAMDAEVDKFVDQLGCFKTDLEILTKAIFASQFLNTPLDPTSTANEDLIKKLANAWKLIEVQKDRCDPVRLNAPRDKGSFPSAEAMRNSALYRYQIALDQYQSELAKVTPRKTKSLYY